MPHSVLCMGAVPVPLYFALRLLSMLRHHGGAGAIVCWHLQAGSDFFIDTWLTALAGVRACSLVRSSCHPLLQIAAALLAQHLRWRLPAAK